MTEGGPIRKGTRFSTVAQLLIGLAALGVLAEDVILVRQNRRLEESLAPQIVSGAQFHVLGGLALDGRFQAISMPPSDARLLIITFSPGCPACQANQAGWRSLAAALERKGVSVLWVSRDPIDVTRDYALKHGMPLTGTLADPTHRTYVELGLARVPNTVLVGAGGRVEKVWVGRLDQPAWDSLFAYFGEPQRSAGIPAQ